MVNDHGVPLLPVPSWEGIGFQGHQSPCMIIMIGVLFMVMYTRLRVLSYTIKMGLRMGGMKFFYNCKGMDMLFEKRNGMGVVIAFW